MPTARVNEVRDALAARINAAWLTPEEAVLTPAAAGQRERESADDLVVTDTLWKVVASSHAGRKVYVMRAAIRGEPATRADDANDYAFGLYVVERYAGQGDPPEEWIDARIEFCTWLLNLVGNARAVYLLPDSASGGLWPQEAEIASVVDIDQLTENKLFTATLTVTYREQVPAPPEGA